MTENNFLTNQCLIAMPALTDPYFARSVIYICEHSNSGAIGIVINQLLALNLADILEQMKIVPEDPEVLIKIPVLCGGPVHPEKGFVIHSPEGTWQSSLVMNSEISVTTSKDILQDIAQKKGPKELIFSLGYANWAEGQLEKEIIKNVWLTTPVDKNLLFNVPFNERWDKAMSILGVDINRLITDGGNA